MQRTIDRILDSAMNNPAELDLGKADNPAKNKDVTLKASKHVAIEERNYFAVNASLECLKALEEYLKIVINLPLLTTDALSKIIEYLKVFSVHLLILGSVMLTLGCSNLILERVRSFWALEQCDQPG